MRRRGFTLVELIIVVSIVGILASAFTYSVIPMINTFFYFPQSGRVNNAAADLLQIVVEGDEKAEGLRFTGLPCAPRAWVTGTAYVVGDVVLESNFVYTCIVGHTAGTFATDLTAVRWTTSRITTASTSGSTSTLTYRYVDPSYCAAGGAGTSHSVTLVYDSSTDKVTRSIDGGAATNIPSYVNSNSEIQFTVSGGGTDLFHYFDAAGTDLGAAPTLASIYRVDIDVIASSGTGKTTDNSGQMRLKTGVEIKGYIT